MTESRDPSARAFALARNKRRRLLQIREVCSHRQDRLFRLYAGERARATTRYPTSAKGGQRWGTLNRF